MTAKKERQAVSQTRRVPMCGACGGTGGHHYAMCDFTDGSAIR